MISYKKFEENLLYTIETEFNFRDYAINTHGPHGGGYNINFCILNHVVKEDLYQLLSDVIGMSNKEYNLVLDNFNVLNKINYKDPIEIKTNNISISVYLYRRRFSKDKYVCIDMQFDSMRNLLDSNLYQGKTLRDVWEEIF